MFDGGWGCYPVKVLLSIALHNAMATIEIPGSYSNHKDTWLPQQSWIYLIAMANGDTLPSWLPWQLWRQLVGMTIIEVPGCHGKWRYLVTIATMEIPCNYIAMVAMRIKDIFMVAVVILEISCCYNNRGVTILPW